MKKYNKILVNVCLLAFSFIMIAATIILWKRNIENPLQFFIPLLTGLYSLGLLSLFAIGWSYERRLQLVVIAFSTAIGLLGFEIILSFVKENDSHSIKTVREKAGQKLGIPFDKRTKFEVAATLQKQGENAWPNIGPQAYIDNNGIDFNGSKIFPLGAISAAHMVLCNESGHFSTHHTDEHGFNNPKGLYQQDIDVLIVGDSYAHGACVDEGQDIASILRKLGTSKVLTLASGGIGPLIELATLSEFGKYLKPKTILWFHSEGSDLADLESEAHSTFLLNYLNDNFSQNLFNSQKNADAALVQYLNVNGQQLEALALQPPLKPSLKSVIKLSALRNQLMLNREKASSFNSPKGLFETVIVTAKRRANQWGSKFVFVYVPSYDRFQSKNISAFDQRQFKNEIFEIMKNNHIEVIDLTPLLTKQPDPLELFPLKMVGHYTPEGYELISNYIFEKLQDKKTG
jgi:hypothetical protein